MTGRTVAVRREARNRRAERRFVGNAAQALGHLEAGVDVVLATRGQFSLSGLVEAAVREIGPAAASVLTWTAGRRQIGHLARLLEAGRLTSCRWWVDPSLQRRQPSYAAALLAAFGAAAVRCAPVHAKAVVLLNGSHAVTIRGSLNMNAALRFELLEVSDDPVLAAFLLGLVDDVFRTVPAGLAGADGAVTVLEAAFGADVEAVDRVAGVGPDLADAGRPGFSAGV